MVFVCVDVESYERAHHKITEIGIATLDTRDLAGVAPGKDGEHWRSKIRARHFRIRDNAHLVNSDFVVGCPDRFDFGKSEWLRLADAPAVVGACFKPPFCAHTPEGANGFVTMMDTLDLGEERNLIFLGHDTLGDVKYLQRAGFDPLTLPNLLEAQDTATMYRVWRREQQPTTLGKILYDFDIAGFNLHNAGNDAVFTVQAMLAICVREASIRGTTDMKEKRDEENAAKLTVAQEEAKKQAEDEAAGWSDHEAVGDGGAPVPIVIKETPMPSSAADRAHKGSTLVQPQGFVGFGAPNLSNSRGAGRGGRGSANGSAIKGDSIRRNGAYHNSDSSTSASDRGGHRNPGRPRSAGQSPRGGRFHTESRGQGRGRGGGRGRARGSFGPGTHSRSDDGYPPPEPEVCHDLIDLS